MITTSFTRDNQILIKDFVPVNLYDGRLCAWDGKTPVDGGLFSPENHQRYERAKLELDRMFSNLKKRYMKDSKLKTFTDEFSESSDLIRFCVLESMVRLSSPYTGYYYGTYQDLNEVVPFADSTIKSAVKELIRREKIEIVGNRSGRKVFVVND